MEFKLLRGETAPEVFQKLGLPGDEARAASNALFKHVEPHSLKAGHRYSAFFNPDSSLASFELTIEGTGKVEMDRIGSGWASRWQPFERSVELRALRGTLDGSLETSIRRAGGPVNLAYRMAQVLQWDLDFTRDLKRGDRFQVLYEEIRLDGQLHDVGQVLALVYDAQGRRHEAYRFGDGGIYYDGQGEPLKKMFLRSPLRYSRITSTFSQHRFHPVLKIYRPHYGVDYGAPVGTPVQVTANGVVTLAGWDRGGGNVVKVRHGQDYVTCYLHLSRFASGIRPGARVRQGDIIAYTGATGLATGPHLDYRVTYRNAWIDPLTLKGVRDEPIPGNRLASFRTWRDELLGSLARGVVSPEVLNTPAPGRPDTRLAVNDSSRRPSQPLRAAVAR
jgi:murein DD-endopeptidase MepM/ murein hydrolase activator NlpD